MRFFLCILLQILLLGTLVTAAEECSASKPCEIGCCSKYGFCGLGPNFCSKKICVNNCERKAECDPGEFGNQFVNSTKCPLNVCCSRHGFCGTTKDFCGNKKVKRPSCSVKNQGFDRVVGYYEGWSSNRPCNKFYPEQLPVGVYTHLNYAFASINPHTYQVIPSLPSDVLMYKRLTNLKKADPDLKVFIAIGGWTFNDPGPTATTFSDIARSEAATNKFADSLISFMSTYNFDGVDLDWEYPGADDRHGRSEDYKNFPIFLRRLRAKLKATNGRDGISLTLPASYWYLQHFDINAMQKHVDFFNIMSYDLHGTWDRGNKWVGSHLNAHTNLTEITEALDLLWRNKLSADKVVLGLAFYGRAFTVNNPSCTKPGCLYASGGKKRACSSEVGVILNSEIEEVLNSTKAKPILYSKETVKILNYETNQWVAYDDGDTFKLKADFARGQCLGGLMVWAVSHDTKDGKYTAALAKAANRKFVAALPATKDSPSTTTTKHPQCKWTNCAENCPSGWLRVPRRDGGQRPNEYMVDETSCNGLGVHQLCCPPGEEVPKCGWYDFNNGNCGGSCPVGMFEIGSLDKYCGPSYQPACCFGTAKSMQLYNQCSWTKEFPNCNKGECASDVTEIVRSGTGSGDAWCTAHGGNDPFSNKKPTREERKYCCRDDIKDQKWTDCEWESHLGVVPKGWGGRDYCLSGCPSNKVRVSMDHNNKECSRGARSMCCTPAYSTVVKRELKDDELAEALDIFLDNPKCTNETQSYRYDSQETVIYRLSKILYGSVSLDTVATWDSKVGGKYKALSYKALTAWARSDEYALRVGSTDLPQKIVCQLSYFNKIIGGGEVLRCYEGRSDRPKSKRSLPDHLDLPVDVASRADTTPNPYHLLQKRDTPLQISTISRLTGLQITFRIYAIDYPTSGEWYDVDDIWRRVLDFTGSMCSDPMVGSIFRVPGNNVDLVTEHIFEKQSVRNFIQSTIDGLLPSGAMSVFSGIDPVFWTRTAFERLSGVPPIGSGELAPVRRLMTVVGANNYETVFVLAGKALNGAKASIWAYNDPTARSEMEAYLTGDVVQFLNSLREALGTFIYLNNDIVNVRLVNIIVNIRRELFLAEELHKSIYGATARVFAVERFDEWVNDHFETIALNVATWSSNWIERALELWNTQQNHPLYGQVVGSLLALSALAGGLQVKLDGVPGQ